MASFTVGQKWKNSFSGSTGEIREVEFASLKFKMEYHTEDDPLLRISKKSVTDHWDLVEDTPLTLQVNDQIKSFASGSPVTILWIKEDGTKYLVRGENSEWLIDSETVRKYWTKVLPEVLPKDVERVSRRNADNGTGEETFRLSDNMWGLGRSMRAVVNGSGGVLVVGENVKDDYFGMYLTLDHLRFLISEREKYENSKG